MKRILVIGIKGMAGHVVFNSLSLNHDYDVYGIARNIQATKNIYNLDIINTSELEGIITQNFDIVINCIGILNKDAEENPNKAIWFNSYFPHFLESITKNTKTKVISISTDCVFSGSKGGYSEVDVKDGIGFYSQSKALGELDNEKDLTIRTSIIGPELNKNGIGLFHWFMQQKGEINGYSKAYWSGITTIELAKVLDEVINQNITGLIIISPENKIDKFNLLKLFNKIFKNNLLEINENSSYKVDKSMISNRTDFKYKIPSYEDMLNDMKSWIDNNSQLYK